ncbi:MAG: ORF6N domain-containing protein [Saprospiraceae bacterium]|nr:ORF6N domain-containing protein [Saprospiraceae bacterium]
MTGDKSVIPDEVLLTKIYEIRGHKVMLDYDLAELYGVKTKVLKQAVRRKIGRFPDDFMFELSKKEFEILRSQIVTSKSGGTRYMPLAFTEHGVLMLSSILNSDRAVEINIQIMRIFTKMRQLLLTHKDLLLKLEQIERTVSSHDDQIVVLFEYLKKLMEEKEIRQEQESRKRIGFKKDDK